MATYRRLFVPGACYFFTVTTANRQPLLIKPFFYETLKTSIAQVKRVYPFAIEAFVLLPDHLHCIWTLPDGDYDYSKRWSIIKRLTSQATRHLLVDIFSPAARNRRGLGLWQRRFWEHLIRDENDFYAHLDYIHWNPVKHSYVSRAVDWPYSSFHKFLKKGVYSESWAADDTEGEFGEQE